MDPSYKRSFDELVKVGSKWWYTSNLTYDRDRHVYPVTKVGTDSVTVALDDKGGVHSEYSDMFLKKFTPAREILPAPVYDLQVIMIQAKQFGMSNEIHELLVETDI